MDESVQMEIPRRRVTLATAFPCLDKASTISLLRFSTPDSGRALLFVLNYSKPSRRIGITALSDCRV